MLINYKEKIETRDDSEIDEQQMVKSIYSLVLSHYVLSVKGGWQNLEETVNFLLIHSEQVFLLLLHRTYFSFSKLPKNKLCESHVSTGWHLVSVICS